MKRKFFILSVLVMMHCALASPSLGKQSSQEILNSLNTTLAPLSFATQDPRSNFIDEWNNSYQFAVKGNQFIITYRLENTLFKGAEWKSHYIETGTYSASLDLLSNASVLPFSQTLGIAIICNEKEKCFTQESSGQYEHKGKISPNKFSKSSHRINLMLPEDLIGPTIDLLQDLLYP
jgi:hypothetical protein